MINKYSQANCETKVAPTHATPLLWVPADELLQTGSASRNYHKMVLLQRIDRTLGKVRTPVAPNLTDFAKLSTKPYSSSTLSYVIFYAFFNEYEIVLHLEGSLFDPGSLIE